MNKIAEKFKNITAQQWLPALVIFTLGFIVAFGLRFWLVSLPEPTHYHANFALYINGVRSEFKDFTFYEEISACDPENSNKPQSRVHMHSQKNDEVHIHDEAATWGHFFANLNYGLTNKLLQTDNEVFVDGVNSNELTFILNGKKVSDIYNRTIGDKDALLIDYGITDEQTLQKRYEQIQKTASELDETQDPAACAGSESESIGERFKRTLGIQDTHSH
jgi:hypothetical protein